MSDKDTELSKDQKAKFLEWLKSKQAVGHCPVCNTNSWTIGSHLISGIIIRSTGDIIIGGSSYPMAFIVCNNCSYVRQFMAMPIGLLEEKKPEEEPDG